MNLGQTALRIWVFVAEITDKFIMGLDVLRIHEATVDLGRHVLRIGREVSRSFRLIMAGDEMILDRCGRVMKAELEDPWRRQTTLWNPASKRKQRSPPAKDCGSTPLRPLTLKHSGNVRMPDGVRPAGPHEACLVQVDVIVVGHTFQEQLENLQMVLQRFHAAPLKPLCANSSRRDGTWDISHRKD